MLFRAPLEREFRTHQPELFIEAFRDAEGEDAPWVDAPRVVGVALNRDGSESGHVWDRKAGGMLVEFG